MSIRTVFLPAMLMCLAACASSRGAANSSTAADEFRFTGTIEAVDDGCLADGICSLTVDGRKVVWMVGWSHDTWGTVSAERVMGARVEVWCRRTPSGCELRGNQRYYIRPAQR